MEAAAEDCHVHFTDNFIIAATAASLVGFNSQLGPVSQSGERGEGVENGEGQVYGAP